MERLTQLTTFGVNQTRPGGYHDRTYAVLSGSEVLFNLVDASAMTRFVQARSARSARLFHMDGLDSSGKKVFTIRRQLEFMVDKLELYMNDGLANTVHVKQFSLKPVFRIHDEQDRRTLSVIGQFIVTSQFRIETTTKTDIGCIIKKWMPWGTQQTPLEYDYVINVPADLDVQLKLAVMATCVFVDFMSLES